MFIKYTYPTMNPQKTLKNLEKRGWQNAKKVQPSNDRNVVIMIGVFYKNRVEELVEEIGFYRDGNWESFNAKSVLKDDAKVLFWFPYPSII